MQWGFTKEGVEAITRIKKQEGIKLGGTYTGKAFAVLIEGVKKPRFERRGGSFWNTYNFRT
jgi:1-aminocyclopropane-1-carboxylate deaminase/D-cysteine desulfhydrase-like pyridoxal-dependent ACC family enzyme